MTLSDGLPIEVRRLQFLELEDQVPNEDPGLYIHTYVVNGYPQEVGYGLEDYAEIPERPAQPLHEAEVGSYLEAQWEQYNLYRAVLTHERKRADLRDKYLIDCAKYILETCISPEDRMRILTTEDYQMVYNAALCPEVTEGDIVAVLAQTFQGNVEGQAFVEFIESAAEIGRVLYSNPVVGIALDAKLGVGQD